MKKILRFVAGVGLTLLGVIGLIMPIMPGWVFLIPGLVILLGDYIPPIKRLLAWAREKAQSSVGATGGTGNEIKPSHSGWLETH